MLSVGCGWHPGRHLFPKPAWRMTGVEIDEAVVRHLVDAGELDEGLSGRAGELPLPDESFDVVLYRLVLHHIVFQGPLQPVFAEARRLLRPGGALVAVEPGSWHPVGAGLALANRLGLGPLVHGTPDDVPLSPRRLLEEARAAGLEPELHAVSYGWRRLPRRRSRRFSRSIRSARGRGWPRWATRSCCWLLGLVALRDDLLAPRPVRPWHARLHPVELDSEFSISGRPTASRGRLGERLTSR